MRSLVKRILLGPIAASGAPALLHGLRYRRSLTIATYHGLLVAPLPVPDWCFLDVSAFRDQLRYLKERFHVLPLEEAVARLRQGTLTRPAAAITFDDGFQSVHDLGFPILQALAVPATVFLNTGICGTQDTVWFCRLHRALCRTGRPSLSWRGEGIDLRGVRRRGAASALLQRSLKRLPHEEMLAETRRIITELGDDPDEAIGPASPYRMLDHQSIRAMAASGLVDFGGHTHRHTILTRIDAARRQEELARSRAGVAALTGRPCRSFAYPNGGPGDYDRAAVDALKALGVSIAVTSIAGPNTQESPPLELRRYGIGGGTTLATFRCMIHHLLSPS